MAQSYSHSITENGGIKLCGLISEQLTKLWLVCARDLVHSTQKCHLWTYRPYRHTTHTPHGNPLVDVSCKTLSKHLRAFLPQGGSCCTLRFYVQCGHEEHRVWLQIHARGYVLPASLLRWVLSCLALGAHDGCLQGICVCYIKLFPFCKFRDLTIAQ